MVERTAAALVLVSMATTPGVLQEPDPRRLEVAEVSGHVGESATVCGWVGGVERDATGGAALTLAGTLVSVSVSIPGAGQAELREIADAGFICATGAIEPGPRMRVARDGVQRAVGLAEPDVTAPVLQHQVLPEYPEEHTDRGIAGDVYLEGVITPEGRVISPRIRGGLEDEELRRRSLEALRQWEFAPGRQGRSRPW